MEQWLASEDCFQQERTDEKYNMSSALHRKLQSKIEALRILRKEMEKFRTERDQFKLMAETLQLRYSTIKRSTADYNTNCSFGEKTSVANILHDTRERNIRLTTELEALKQKLNELQGDIELLREKEKRRETGNVVVNSRNREPEEQQWKKERADFISYLENLKKKNAQLSFDLKALIDEKEEAVTERDAYKCKAHRLNHELFVALKANETHPRFLDIDSVLLENKYLHERLSNCESELEIVKQTVNKYKKMLDPKRKKGIIKLGNSCNEDSILSHKQVKNMLENGIDLPTKAETISDLKTLCLALLDNLNDKNIALSHQKKTNKILATKIAELEQRIQALVTDESFHFNGFSPSQILLNGYSPSNVDNGINDNLHRNSNKSEVDSGTMSSEAEPEKSIEKSKISEDAMSSLSTDSLRSILSSEYGNFNGDGADDNICPNLCSPSDFTSFYDFKEAGEISPLISSTIAKERSDNLKDLPPELAAMVQKALHELDMRDFDEVVDVEDKVVLDNINESEMTTIEYNEK